MITKPKQVLLELDDERLQKVSRILAERTESVRKCPVCGAENSIRLQNILVAAPAVSPHPPYEMTLRTMPCYSTVCTNCFNTQFFSAVGVDREIDGSHG